MPDDPLTPFDEAPPATEAPAVIHLPSPAEVIPAAPRKRRETGRGGGATKRGRHFGPRPVADPRIAWLTTRTTPEFLDKVRADAKARELSLSDYIHVELGGTPSPRARRNPTELHKLLVQLRAELGKSGSNLNQRAKALNEIRLAVLMDGITDGPLLARLDEMIEDNRQATEDHRRAVAAVERALGLRPEGERDY